MQEQHYYLRRIGEEWEVGEMSAVKLDFSGAAQSRERKPLRTIVAALQEKGIDAKVERVAIQSQPKESE